MTTKKRLTFEGHVEMGKRLKRLHAELLSIRYALGVAYPFKLFEPPLLKIDRLLGIIRSRLEDEMFKEHPDQANIRVYYGVEENAEVVDQLFAFKEGAADLQGLEPWYLALTAEDQLTVQRYLIGFLMLNLKAKEGGKGDNPDTHMARGFLEWLVQAVERGHEALMRRVQQGVVHEEEG